MRRTWLAPVLAVVVLVSGAARAQQLTESERKAAARAAFLEGVKLQESGNAADALGRFEAAEKLFDAPTHLLHIAQCLAATNKLVEASETYETLIHKNLGSGAPDAFVQAQEQGKSELTALQARIPSIRVGVKQPDPKTLQNLQVTINGAQMPNELLGIARPVNPGTYRINAVASGYKTAAPVDVSVAEKDKKDADLVLVASTGAAPVVVVTPAPVPPPYGATTATPPDTAAPAEKKPEVERSSPVGVLVGGRLGVVVPGGGVIASPGGRSDVSFDNVAGTGVGVGVDLMARFARILLAGGTLEYAGLSGPSTLASDLAKGVQGETSTSTFYLGVNFGIVPNIDRTSLIADVGLGIRSLSRSITVGSAKANESLSGLEGALGAGLAIPAGKVRIVPKATLNIGSFGKVTSDCAGSGVAATYSRCLPDGTVTDTAVHTFIFVGVAVYYHADVGKK